MNKLHNEHTAGLSAAVCRHYPAYRGHTCACLLHGSVSLAEFELDSPAAGVRGQRCDAGSQHVRHRTQSGLPLHTQNSGGSSLN